MGMILSVIGCPPSLFALRRLQHAVLDQEVVDRLAHQDRVEQGGRMADNAQPRRKRRPWGTWVLVTFCVLVVAGVAFAAHVVSTEKREKREAKRLQDQRSEWDHYCGAWKADPYEFVACTGALEVYRICQEAFQVALEREGRGDVGVSCDHETCQFHALEQKDIQQMIEQSAQQSK